MKNYDQDKEEKKLMKHDQGHKRTLDEAHNSPNAAESASADIISQNKRLRYEDE